jgi:predicted metalloprotease with PDZ domain
MAIQSWRRTVFHFTTAAATCAIVASVAAQPPRPTADDPAERRPVPPRTEREPGYLGLVTDDRRDQGQAVRVIKVVEDSPAAKAGFAVDDLIVAVGGQPTGSLDEMAAQLQPRDAGEKVRFEVRRGGATQTLEVELGRRPARDLRPLHFPMRDHWRPARRQWRPVVRCWESARRLLPRMSVNAWAFRTLRAHA